MTWFLDRAQQAKEVLTDLLPDAGEQFTGAIRKVHIEGDRWNTNWKAQVDLTEEMIDKLGGLEVVSERYRREHPRVSPRQHIDPRYNPEWVLEAAKDVMQFEPELWGDSPRDMTSFHTTWKARLEAERGDLEEMMGRGDAPWTQFAGQMIGSIDDVDVITAPVGGAPKAGIWGFARWLTAEGFIGAASEVPAALKEQEQAKRLGFEAGDFGTQVAMGGLFSAGFAGVLGGGAKALQYAFGRRRGEDALAAELGEDALSLRAQTDAAEEALRLGKTPPPPAPLRPNINLPAEEDPAVQNILSLITRAEAPKGFDQVSDFTVIAPPRPLTRMTVDEVLAWQAANANAGAKSTAAGGVQIIQDTLTGLKDEMGLSGSEVFDEALQRRMAVQLAKRRGLEDWRAGRLSNEDFANNLAQEWAGLPLVTGPRAGRSFYDGDGLNGATVSNDDFLSVLGGEQYSFTPSGGGGNVGRAVADAGSYSGGGYTRSGDAPAMPLPSEISTPAGSRVSVKWRVVDLADLRKATGDLQPRDRARAASDDQVAKIARDLDAARLMPGPESDRGAPIIGPDMTIESGNGRVLGIARAADLHPEKYQAYVQAIREQGFDIPEGMKRPVLVAERTTALDFEGRRRFVRESNTSAIARMSATEQAQFDADYVTRRAFDAYRPDKSIRQPENAEFVRRIFAGITPEERAVLMKAGGALSPEGDRRLRAALFARAFDAEELLNLALEADDRAITNLIRMMEDLAPNWAAFRAMVDDGFVPPEFDITEALTETLRIIVKARTADRQGQSVIGAIRDRLSQGDMFGEADPMTEALVDVFYKGDRARGAEVSGDILERYAAHVARHGREDAPGLDGPLTPIQALREAIEREEAGAPPSTLPARAEGAREADVDISGVEVAEFDEGAVAPSLAAVADETVEAFAPAAARTADDAVARQADVAAEEDIPAFDFETDDGRMRSGADIAADLQSEAALERALLSCNLKGVHK